MCKSNLHRSVGSNLGRMAFLSILLAACYLMNPNYAAAQTLYGCANNTTGDLRLIAPPAQCKGNETLVNWNVQGPQGVPGPAGPQGIQGEPGPAGTLTRLITVGSGGGTGLTVLPSCSEPLRSLEFVKQTNESRLRITYTDTAFVTSFDNALILGYWVEVRIDGAVVSPTPIENGIRGGNSLASDEFMKFGYADGIPAGTHTLTTLYKFNGTPPDRCVRIGSYTIEVEEIP